MTYERIVNTIITELQGVFDAMPQPEDGDLNPYKIIVCPERIFVDDYAAAEQEYVASISDSNELFGENPNESPYKKIIFVVVKLGSGQKNMAVTGYSLSIQVLSEENDFLFSRALLDKFVNEYNFVYANEMMHSFFPPEMTSSQDSVYIGFRALYSLRGFIRVPELGFFFITNIAVSWTDEEGGMYSGYLPFINATYHYSAQPDPQAFAGFHGETKAMNRQCTETLTISTYLMIDDESESNAIYTAFSKAVLKAKNDINQNFGITLETPISGVNFTANTFKLVGIDYSQSIADISAISLSFTASTEDE